jgi:hypothetical protein
MALRMNYTENQKLNGLIFLRETESKKVGKSTRRFADFKCTKCGKEYNKQITTKTLKAQSCGCYTGTVASIFHTKHGYSKTKLYYVYDAIKNRVLNKNNLYYENYGGRGIKICEEWKNSRIAFLEWALSNGYKEGLTIDRIDNDGDYEPSNCRWVDYYTQSENKRLLIARNTSGYKGVSRNKSKWRATICVKGKWKHIGTFETKEEAAKAYDEYVIINKYNKKTNGVLNGNRAPITTS